MKKQQDISWLVHPKDRSVDAYKGWTKMLMLATRRNPPENLSEEEWRKRCEDFWRDYDAKHPGEVPR
jgi:hypothetical protein